MVVVVIVYKYKHLFYGKCIIIQTTLYIIGSLLVGTNNFLKFTKFKENTELQIKCPVHDVTF